MECVMFAEHVGLTIAFGWKIGTNSGTNSPPRVRVSCPQLIELTIEELLWFHDGWPIVPVVNVVS